MEANEKIEERNKWPMERSVKELSITFKGRRKEKE